MPSRFIKKFKKHLSNYTLYENKKSKPKKERKVFDFFSDPIINFNSSGEGLNGTGINTGTAMLSSIEENPKENLLKELLEDYGVYIEDL